jgi:hypothetical protein
MNQAFKIINTVGLMNQTPTKEMAEEMGPGPILLSPFYIGNIYV